MELLPVGASLGAMGALVGKLDALLDTELKAEIEKIRNCLVMLSKAPDPPVTARIWMRDVRELSYDMENCVDLGEPDWIDRMSGFKARVKEANERYDTYLLRNIPICTDTALDCQLPTVDGRSRSRPNLSVIGLHDGTFPWLCDLLADDDQELKVLSVVGVGGIGKTTLAKQLWRDKKLGNFNCRAFVRTAKKPDMRRILRSILAQVRPHKPPDINEVHELIHSVREHLQDKRYFLIIDDLCATSVWDVVRRAFPEGNGSRILTTTEIENVARACCRYQLDYIFKMKPLSPSQSKELFISGLFGSGEEKSRQLDEVTDEIIRRCGGLPLAIISISKVIASQGEEITEHNREQIQNNLPANTTPDNILKQVLNFCYKCLPSSLQTCLLYLSLYPENYIIFKEDIMKQWVAEGFILAPTENDKMKVAGNYFDNLVDMGLIQHIEADYSDEALYYVVHRTVHDLITSKSIAENFVTVIDYSKRRVRFSNKVSRLSLQFGSAAYATTPESIGLSQVRSLAFMGLKSCLPSILEFKLLRYLTLHMWADQPSTDVDLKPTSELVLLRSLQVTCNGTVHLPDLMQGPKHLQTLEINAIVAAIPANIIHLRRWLHLRLGVGTELPDVTGILKNVTLNPPISLDESICPPKSVTTIELLPPICSIPKWIGQLTNLCSLKIVVRELDDTSSLQELPSLTVLSLHVQRRTTELIGFVTGAFTALEYFEFRCGVLRLIFEEGTMPNLQILKLSFNAHGGEQCSGSLVGIGALLSVQKISVMIGVATGAKKHVYEAAESAFKKAMGKHSSKVSIKRAYMVEEEFDPPEQEHSIRGQHSSASSEPPGSPNQESQDVRGPPEKQYSIQGEHPSESSEQPVSPKQESQQECSPSDRQHSTREKHQPTSSEQALSQKQEPQELDDPLDKQHFIRKNHPSTSSEQHGILPQGSQEITSQNVDSDSDQSINRWSSRRYMGKYSTTSPTNNSFNITSENVMSDIVLPLVIKKLGIALANGELGQANAQFSKYATQLKEVQYSMGRAMRELCAMNHVLCEMDIRNCNNPVYEGWLYKVKKVAHGMEDIVDEYLHQVCQEHDTRFLFYLKKSRSPLSLNQIASNLKKIEEDLTHLFVMKNDWVPMVNNGGTSSSNYIVKRSQDLVNISRSLNEEDLVGMEKNRKKLEQWLGGEDGECSVITLHGMGGLGKTALAAIVYRKERERFQCHAWISNFQTYSRVDFLRNIISELFKDKVSVPSDLFDMDSTSLEVTLKRFLEKNKYLIILDGVWTPEAFIDLSRTLVCNDNGSRLIITTREGDVAALASQGRILTLETLSEDNAWDLFCKHTFLQGIGHECPKELKPLSREIVSKCKGLPLVIVSVGNLLSVCEKTVEEWRRINDQLSSEIINNPMLDHIRNIFHLSFMYLPPYLKSCFLYCSLFPNDYLFHRKKLVRLWMAEGFILEKGASTLEEVAKDYLKELVNRNMLQLVGRNSFGRMNRFRMHDTMRELGVDLCQKDSFYVIYEEDKFGGLLHADGRGLIVHKLKKDIWRSFSGMYGLRTFIALDKKMPSITVLSLLSEKSRYMTVLELSGLPIEKIPDAIGDLFHLRHLGLRDTKVKLLPKTIKKLSNLLTLDLARSDIQELPKGIVKLKNLRHLFAEKVNDKSFKVIHSLRGVCIPNGIDNLLNLQTLQALEAQHESVRQLRELRQLRSLRILNVKRIYCECLCESLMQMPFLSYLEVGASGENEVLMLNALPPKLQKLRLRGKFVEGSGSSFLQVVEKNLHSLSLRWPQLIEDPLPSLSRLANLTDLRFSRAYNGEKLVFLTGWFPKLKFLYLRDLPNLKQLEIEQGAMATLEILTLINLSSMAEVPPGIEFLMPLKYLGFFLITRDFLTVLNQYPGIAGMQWKYSLLN